MLHRKRNKNSKSKPTVSKNRQLEREGVEGDVSQERLRPGRKRETLQTFKKDTLQPWIDLANLFPFESLGNRWIAVDPEPQTLSSAFVREFAGRPRPNPLYHLAQRVTRWQTREPRPSSELVGLFNTVRGLFERLPEMTWPTEGEEPVLNEHYDRVQFSLTFSIEDTGDGRVSFQPDATLTDFKTALEDTEISRVRRCPICGKFYYGVRNNKGACDEHLARARVERGRDPEVRKMYEVNRRINKLVKQKVPIGKAKAKVEETSITRRKI
jgi:hypothetical protein